ncbi:MAG: DsbA family oxidoreductase [Labilithrix sp.]|nr:DsbA family oxidoreductase [Labilithrix sp.]MCW5813161.1 DsbA family oxidoreductase [Labilithrix sp.]
MGEKRDVRIDVWSDVICPWCWLGRARLEKAVAAFGSERVEVVFRSFELDPKSDPDLDVSTNEMLQKKFGIGPAQLEAMHDRLRKLGAADGIEYRFDKTRTSNTFAAHQLVVFAKESGKQLAMVDRLFAANFKEGVRIGDRAALVKLAGEVGLDTSAVEAGLAEDRWAEAVRADEAEARTIGISGVPFFLFDGKVAVSGAESAEVLGRALTKTVAPPVSRC